MSDWYARRLARARTEAPPRQSGPQPAYQQQRPPPGYTPQPAPQSLPPPTIGNLWGAMQQWRGGPAHKIDADSCPQCHGSHYFSRTGTEARRGPPPAPHCFDCGYNGMFEQGLASTWNG